MGQRREGEQGHVRTLTVRQTVPPDSTSGRTFDDQWFLRTVDPWLRLLRLRREHGVLPPGSGT